LSFSLASAQFASFALVLLAVAAPPSAKGQDLPDAPSALIVSALPHSFPTPDGSAGNVFHATYSSSVTELSADPVAADSAFQTSSGQTGGDSSSTATHDKQDRTVTSDTGRQPHRILGLMPNYRTVSAGAVPPPPGFRQSFKIATHQAFDYSTFIFLGLTTETAYLEDSHPSLDTYNGGNAPFWGYLWRGFIDKTDGTYQSAWILPTLLHEDTRYYAMGHGSKWKRLGYSISRVAIARTYGGHWTPNLAGLGGKVGAQAVSTTYYPPSSEPFSVLATKFGYSCARDVGFTVFREFYPDIAIHILHRNP
jgi:hypothetical protein